LLPALSVIHAWSLPLAFSSQPQQPRPAAPPRATGTSPIDPLLEQARAAIERKDFARAVESLEQFLAKHPDHIPARFNLAYSYGELKRFAEARQHYEEILKQEPDLYQANLNLAVILVEQRDFSSAVGPLEKVVTHKPSDARARYLLGFALEKTGKFAQAAEHYRAGLQADPKDLELHLSLGRVAYELKDLQQAESEFRAAVALRKDSPLAILGLAEILLAQDHLPLAAAQFESYLSLNPNDGDTRLRLAGLYSDLDQPNEALRTLRAASADLQQDPKWKEMAARAYAMLKRWPDAIPLYQDVALARPDDAAILAALGEALLKDRQFQASARALEKALVLQPSSPQAVREVRKNLVSARYLAGDYPAALAALDALAAHEPLPAILLFVRATCYDHLRQTKAAVENYEKFLALADGKHPDQEFQARHRLVALKRELVGR
jgi:tetratricopeptide (TPR) repeat protein